MTTMQVMQCVTVTGGHIGKATLVVQNTKDVDGTIVVKASKSDFSFTRLLGLKVKLWGEKKISRPLSNTNIIESLTQLRDDAYYKWCSGPKAATEDLMFDDEVPRSKLVPRADMPKLDKIKTLEFDTAPSIDMTVSLNAVDRADGGEHGVHCERRQVPDRIRHHQKQAQQDR